MPPNIGAELLEGGVESVVVSAADAVNFEKVEKKWWWKPLTKFLLIAPFIALGIYYFS
jgi:hypothetical protein